MIGLGSGLGILTIPTWFWWALGLGIPGCLLLFVSTSAINGTRFLRVPDGVVPDLFYRQWRDKKFSQRVSRGLLFVLGFAVALTVTGCGIFTVGWFF
ncbi:MAG: hypothetical protein L0331_05890 [Chloroflexi bacterium]|nr:hypothetical protein [Chloroflexota bacterium]